MIPDDREELVHLYIQVPDAKKGEACMKRYEAKIAGWISEKSGVSVS